MCQAGYPSFKKCAEHLLANVKKSANGDGVAYLGGIASSTIVLIPLQPFLL